jgi:3-hydroxyisobutyrate dehydrogenase-like beta-hydroxyacid dehydrogenase
MLTLDGCVFAGAEAGTLTFMVGGNKAAAEAATPILRHMGTAVIHCGDHGSGISAKICNNLVLAASMAALSEALALGKRLGLDPNVLTDVSAQCNGSCEVVHNMCFGMHSLHATALCLLPVWLHCQRRWRWANAWGWPQTC